MGSHEALAAAATLVATAFALSTLERWLDRRRPHELAWTVSLGCFAAGSAALWWGAATGWDQWSFRLFYLFGAVLNVPILALGTVWLLARPATARLSTSVVGLLCAFATGVLVTAPMHGSIEPDVLPRGSDVFGVLPRVLAASASGGGALVLFGGAVASAWRLARGAATRRLAAANGLIAAGTVVLSAGGLFNSVLDEMDAFAVTLVIGIAVIFGGFLLTARPRRVLRPLPAEEPVPGAASGRSAVRAG